MTIVSLMAGCLASNSPPSRILILSGLRLRVVWSLVSWLCSSSGQV